MSVAASTFSFSRRKLMGYGAAFVTVLIWSSYFLSLRFRALSPMGIFDLALLRFCIPGVMLGWLLVKQRQRILEVKVRYLLGIILGAGLPFFLLSAAAMNWSPVADGSTLIPGAAPLFVTGIAVLIFNQRLTALRIAGLLAIALGVASFLYSSLLDPNLELLHGHLLFLVCSFLWALFTISVRQSGLKPLEVTAVLTVPNGVLLVAWGLVMQPELTWNSLPAGDLVALMLTQGIAVGLGSGILYAYAITRLGAEVTSAVGSMTPVCATLLAAILLSESVELTALFGSILVTAGVIGLSGVLNRASV
jgi:drug/metabolite transporter (DMT)-like permease